MVSNVPQSGKLIDYFSEDLWEWVKFAYGVSRLTQESVFWVMAEKDETRKTVDFYAIDDLSVEGTKLFTRTKNDWDETKWEGATQTIWAEGETPKVATNEDIAIAMAEFLSRFIESVYNERTLNVRIKINPKIPLEIYEMALGILDKWCKIDSGVLKKDSGFMLLIYE